MKSIFWRAGSVLVVSVAVAIGASQAMPVIVPLVLSGGVIGEDDAPASFSARWRDSSGAGTIKSNGVVEFTDDLRDVARVSDGASLMMETRHFLISRGARIERRGDTVTRTYYLNGIERSWDKGAQRWLSAELPSLVRRSGVSARERVNQLFSAGGVNAVLAEIGRLETDSVRARYLRTLFEHPGLDCAGLDRGVRLAVDLIESSADLGATVKSAIARGCADLDSLLYAVTRISSSAEQGEVLIAVLHSSALTPVRQVDFLTAAASIESNAECASVLVAFADRYSVRSGPVRAAFLHAAATVDSDFERGQLLAM